MAYAVQNTIETGEHQRVYGTIAAGTLTINVDTIRYSNAAGRWVVHHWDGFVGGVTTNSQVVAIWGAVMVGFALDGYPNELINPTVQLRIIAEIDRLRLLA